MELSFEQLANTKMGEVKPPVNLPTGHYEAMISGAATPHKARSGNIALRFPCTVVSAGEDVDSEALANVIEVSGKALSDRKFNLDYWLSPDAQFRFTEFAKSCGVDDDNLTLVEIAERLVEEKTRFTVEVKHEQDQADPNKVYVRFDNAVGFGTD